MSKKIWVKTTTNELSFKIQGQRVNHRNPIRVTLNQDVKKMLRDNAIIEAEKKKPVVKKSIVEKK